jgi:hypothetical protein
MGIHADILNKYKEIAESFLWKGQWISADEWTKHLISKGLKPSVTVEDVNRVLKKEAAMVSHFNGVAERKLFVNKRRVNKLEQVMVAATTASVGAQRFETVNKYVNFYYIPTTEGKTPDIPTDTQSWQGFYDDNKIASRSYRTTTKKRRHQDEEQDEEQENQDEEQQDSSQPLQNTTTPRVSTAAAGTVVVTDNRIRTAMNINMNTAGIFSPPPAAAATTASCRMNSNNNSNSNAMYVPSRVRCLAL